MLARQICFPRLLLAALAVAVLADAAAESTDVSKAGEVSNPIVGFPWLPAPSPTLPVALARVGDPSTPYGLAGLPPPDAKLPVAQPRSSPFPTTATTSSLPIATPIQFLPGALRPPFDLTKLPTASGVSLLPGFVTIRPPDPNLPVAQGVAVTPPGP